jgi:hypothetical protein
LPGTFTIEGSILDDVDAEYVAMTGRQFRR